MKTKVKGILFLFLIAALYSGCKQESSSKGREGRELSSLKYAHGQDSFIIAVPKNWKRQINTQGSPILLIAGEPSAYEGKGQGATLNIVVRSVSNDMKLKEFVNIGTRALEEDILDFGLISQNCNDSLQERICILNYKFTEKGTPARGRIVFLEKQGGSRIYMISFSCPESAFSEFDSKFTQITKSFKLL